MSFEFIPKQPIYMHNLTGGKQSISFNGQINYYDFEFSTN